MKRCSWANQSELEKEYHDTEWGVPLHNDQKLFEFITLEGAQAGLSWSTILQKREGYREAFDNFDFHKIANYKLQKLDTLRENPNIVRNKLKIHSVVNNAQVTLKIIEEFGSLDAYLWGFVNGKPIINSWKTADEVPVSTPLSDKMSKDMKKRGFKFIGTTICYALIQAIGMVNDHTTDCFRYEETI